MDLNKRQYQFLEDLRDRYSDPKRRWVSVEDEDPDITRPLIRAAYVFVKNGQARITTRGILKLETDGGWIKPLKRVRGCVNCKMNEEILDHLEKKHPEIKHLRAIRKLQYQISRRKIN